MQHIFTAAKTKMGRTTPSTGPRVGHSWSKRFLCFPCWSTVAD